MKGHELLPKKVGHIFHQYLDFYAIVGGDMMEYAYTYGQIEIAINSYVLVHNSGRNW